MYFFTENVILLYFYPPVAWTSLCMTWIGSFPLSLLETYFVHEIFWPIQAEKTLVEHSRTLSTHDNHDK